MAIVCDHQSVVSEANRMKVKHPSELLVKLRNVLKDASLELEALHSNPSHKTLTEYVNRVTSESDPD
jgi:prephenate dehydratase